MAGKPGMMTCPYDKSHEIDPERFQFHLVRCGRNFVTQELVTCIYNNTHRIPKPELPFHLENCVDKRKLDTFMNPTGDPDSPNDGTIGANEGSVPKSDENWDEAPPCSSALDVIQREIEERPVLRAIKVSSKAKKKTFHQQERQRLNGLIEATANMSLESTSQSGAQKKPNGPQRNQNATLKMVTASGSVGRGQVTDEAVARPSSSRPGRSTEIVVGLSSASPGTSPGHHVNNIREEFPTLPGPCTAARGVSFNVRDKSPSLPVPGLNNGFCNLPIPGRGRGRIRK